MAKIHANLGIPWITRDFRSLRFWQQHTFEFKAQIVGLRSKNHSHTTIEWNWADRESRIFWLQSSEFRTVRFHISANSILVENLEENNTHTDECVFVPKAKTNALKRIRKIWSWPLFGMQRLLRCIELTRNSHHSGHHHNNSKPT